MKQLNWYQIFGQTHTIPDGSTVTPTDDVQILLNCANIWDKAYTTIADLLSDTTSLLAVIVDNNAINYLVRSTTFASSVTADATAMTDIGANNYAADTLLADATWCEAICNSEYFVSVLNGKVPDMTSNTTPEGLCFASSQPSGYEAYKAFNDSGSWGTGSITNQYCGYKSENAICVKKVTIAFSQGKTFYVQGSNDNSNYTTLYTGTTPSDTATVSFNVNNENDYLYNRVYVANTWRNTPGFNITVRRIQYYYRKDV